MRPWSEMLNRYTVAGAVGVALFLFLLSALLFYINMPPAAQPFDPSQAMVTRVAAPTGTPSPMITPTPEGTQAPKPGDIPAGAFVQITGTGGQGLRLRAQPGLDGEPLFLGYDAEVFEVTQGPAFADGYAWYYLVASYDQQRAGWAAANYLTVVTNP